MTKLNLDLTQQKIVKELIPDKESKLFYTLDGRISVSEESRQGQKFWVADIPLASKDPEDDSLLDPPHFVSTFRLERGAKGREYLVVDPQLYCGSATKLCSNLTSKVVRWRDNIRGNSAVASFIQKIMKEDPDHLTIVSSADFLEIQSRPEEMTGLSWGDWALLGGGVLGGLGGVGILATLWRRRRALQEAQKPVTFFIGREPGEGGVETRTGTEVEKYISRRQVEITFDPRTKKYFARHVGNLPTRVQHPQYEYTLNGTSPSEIKPGDHFVIRSPDGKELLKIEFHHDPQETNPRSAFSLARSATWVDVSPRRNQGVSVPSPIRRDPPPLPPAPESPERKQIVLPKSPSIVPQGLSPQERDTLLQRYQQELSDFSECLTMEGEGGSKHALLILYNSRNGQITELLQHPDLPMKEISEEEFQLALEYARLKNPLIKGYHTLKKEKTAKEVDKQATEKLIDQAIQKKDSTQETQLKLYRERLRQRIEEIDALLPQWERLVRDFHPFDLIHELNVLKEEKQIKATPPSVKAWQATRVEENQKKIEKLEASLEYVPKGDRDLVRWAIDRLAHPLAPMSVENRAKLATILHYVTLLTEEPQVKRHRATQAKVENPNAYRQVKTNPAYREELERAKANLEKERQSSPPRAPFRLTELFERREKVEKMSSPEARSQSVEGPSPEQVHLEIRSEDVTRKPGRGPGGRGQPEIRVEDPLDLLKGPEELRDIFEVVKVRGGVHR